MYSQYRSILQKVIAEMDTSNFDLALEMIVQALSSQTAIYIFGNGGSSANASHFVVDWRKGVSEKLGFYPKVYSLTDNVPLLTAIANDIDYNVVFAEQLRNIGKPKDIALAISGSGNSQNIINGIKMANSLEMQTISLTGFNGGQVGKLSKLNCLVDSTNIRVVEDIHASFGHSVVEAVVSEF